MRIKLVGALVALFAMAATASAGAAPGDLDPTFGEGDGMVTTDFGGADPGRAVTVQPNGKIVVAGGSGDFALARYNQDGSLDAGFGGGDGLVTTAFPGSEGDEGNALLLQPSGRLVVAGTTHIPPHGRGSFALARYNGDGTPDTGFGGGDGLVTGIDNYEATSAGLAPNGQILVAGGWESFRVARFNSDGSVDTGFDGTAALFPDYQGTARLAYGVQVQKEGRVVAAGYVNDDVTSATDFAVARFDTDGSLDASFGEDGMVTTDFSGGGDYARAVALQPDGSVIVAGRTESPESDFAVARYQDNGPPAAAGPAPPASAGSPSKSAQAEAPQKAGPRVNGSLRKCRTRKSKRAKRKCARRNAPRSSASAKARSPF